MGSVSPTGLAGVEYASKSPTSTPSGHNYSSSRLNGKPSPSAKREAKPIDHFTKQPSIFGTSASERKKDFNGPSIATLGLFEQTPDD